MCLKLFLKKKNTEISETKKDEYEDFSNLTKSINNWLQKNNLKTNKEPAKKYSYNFTVYCFSHILHNTLLFKNYSGHEAILILYNEYYEAKITYTRSRKYLIYLGAQVHELNESSFIHFLEESRKLVRNEKLLFTDTFEIEENSEYPILTDFICPECKKGNLEVEKKDDIREEDFVNFNNIVKQMEDFDPDFLKFKFAGYLTCCKCKEKIIIAGDSSYYNYGDEDMWYSGRDYQINYFEQVNDLINIDSLLNIRLQTLLRDSFRLYYIDKKACVNRIRCFLDEYLTYLGVSETTLSGDFKALENRIRECKQLTDNQKNSLITIKDVGNNASHGTGEVSATDIFMTYKVIETVLQAQKSKNYEKELAEKYSK